MRKEDGLADSPAGNRSTSVPEAGRVIGGGGLKLGQEKGMAQTLEWETGMRLTGKLSCVLRDRGCVG